MAPIVPNYLRLHLFVIIGTVQGPFFPRFCAAFGKKETIRGV